MAQVKWTLQALDDLEAICLFIARDAPPVAAVFADRAFRATDRLVQHPRLGRIVPELELETIREIILGNYRFLFRVTYSASGSCTAGKLSIHDKSLPTTSSSIVA